MKKYRSTGVVDFKSFGIDRESIRKDQIFELEDEAAGQRIVDAGLAHEYVEPPAAPPPSEAAAKTVRVRVLAVSAHGQPNDVIDLPTAQLKQAKADGLVDDEKASVAYALSLKKPVK